MDDAAKKTSTQSDAKSTIEIRLTQDGKGLEISRKVSNQPDVKELLVPDGARRPIAESNCTGWQTSRLVPDAGLIISSSEMNCRDTGLLATTNVKMILAADRMADVLALKTAGQTRLAVRRLAFEKDLPAENDAQPAFVSIVDRMALAEPWKMDTLIQLSKAIEPQVLEAVILEKKVRMDLNADSLRDMKSAKMPKGAIDLIVALAYPDKFHIEKNGSVELRPWIVSSSSTTSAPARVAGNNSVPLIITNYPGMFYNCYSINGYYGYAYSGYPGGCYSYYSPLWWDYPIYVPSAIVVGPGGGGSAPSGGRPDAGRLSAGSGYVQVEPVSTGRKARPREGNVVVSAPASTSGVQNPPRYIESSGAYSGASSSSSGSSGSYSSGTGGSSGAGSSSGSPSASPGGYSSGASSSSGGAVPK